MAEQGSRGIAWSGAVNLIGGATGSVIGLVLAAVVGHQLGTEGAGTYFVVVAVFMVASNVAELGADTGLVRYLSVARATGRPQDVPHLVVVAVRPVVVGGVVVVSGVAASVALSPVRLPDVSGTFVIVAAGVAVLSSLVAVMLAVTRGLGDVLSYPVLQNIALPVLRLGGVLVVVTAGGGTAAVLTAWLVPVPVVLVLATAVALRLLVRRAGGLRTAPASNVDRRRLTRDFWTFSAVRGVSATVEILLEWLDVILVGVLTSAEQAGIYAVVTRCARVGEIVQQAARVAVGPQISAALARGAVDEARQVYGLVTAAMIWMSWPFFVVLAVFPEAVLSIFGPGFEDGAVSLTVLSVAMALATAAGTVQTILLMGGRSSWQLADKAAALTLNVVLTVTLVPVWGIEGAAVAWAVTILADTALVVHQVQHLMGVRPTGHGHQLRTAVALSVGLVGATTVTARLVAGESLAVMATATAVAAVLFVAASVPLRHRLGLTELVRHRSG
ncbi:oligosaccharide flippase family protein [Aeromicrobium fastidiosum]|uniref:Oligosaccharide flippase family protein n=1 Tax=Aeromicrobium fastidiosum TaxID=52699 RepID=A0A641ANS3_9ACTN|nr:oligosaccharide flippase family protein [Aeromicrobium fastidiosum]KAA1379736.1 oligosaccharide flippase family protein [Aeromicrobium fastidiosum]MBP2389223.1 O-antigen/teichoic acid export membrane protein [Aeromicrobium fastidiosum]